MITDSISKNDWKKGHGFNESKVKRRTRNKTKQRKIIAPEKGNMASANKTKQDLFLKGCVVDTILVPEKVIVLNSGRPLM